ncbi:prephenate dehydratase domain-containing protein [Sphingosinicella terrae]|uniref:prephenate dehydratase domain-containing protein n=1 Tax=Sphingosinicella terrae TaxID=2172047 RepID=UPI0013B3D6E9|nr:prephenate dehydratase domain-containing protein [Sphingosinicella terrae]
MTETVAYQGAPGAFGEEACRLFLPDVPTVAKPTFAAVAEAVAAGETALGMLPGENSIAGPVPGVDALIEENELVVRARHDLPVRLHLLGRPGTSIAQIERVVSHPMALAQCRRFLCETGLATEEAANTALAAQALGRSQDPAQGVIASEAAAATYGLVVLRHDVHDRADNFTTFCVVARRESEPR